MIVTITSATALGWMLMLGPGSLSSICGSGAAAAGMGEFPGLWLQWQVMIATMMLPCLTPTIVAVARAERQRYGVLTAAMAFGLSYGSIVSLATGAAALLHPIDFGPAIQASLVCLAVLIGVFRLPSPHWSGAGTDPVRTGLRKGIVDLPSVAQMILVQLAFGLHNTPAMVLMALAMPTGMALRRSRAHRCRRSSRSMLVMMAARGGRTEAHAAGPDPRLDQPGSHLTMRAQGLVLLMIVSASGRRMKQRPMMFAAVETVTQADPVWAAAGGYWGRCQREFRLRLRLRKERQFLRGAKLSAAHRKQ